MNAGKPMTTPPIVKASRPHRCRRGSGVRVTVSEMAASAAAITARPNEGKITPNSRTATWVNGNDALKQATPTNPSANPRASRSE